MATIKQGVNFVLSFELDDVNNVGGPLTSGLLVIGLRYRITTYIAGDDFINVGAASNAADGTSFIATATTPTVWTHGSSVQQITKVPIAADQISGVQVVAHQGTKQLNVWNKGDTAILITDGFVKLEVVKTITNKWLGVVQFKFSPSFVAPDYFLSNAQTDVLCFNDLITVESC